MSDNNIGDGSSRMESGAGDKHVLAETQTAGFGMANGKVVERLIIEFDPGTPAATLVHDRLDYAEPLRDRDPKLETLREIVANPHDSHRTGEQKLETGSGYGKDRVIVDYHEHAPRVYIRHEHFDDGEWTEAAAWELHPVTGVEKVGGELVTDGGQPAESEQTTDQSGGDDRPEEVDAFVDAYADFCQEADDSVKACETLNAYLFDEYAASRLTNYPEPNVPDSLEELAELPIGYGDTLDPDTVGRYFDEAVARLHNRASTGSFYTPEEITEYMTTETIRPRVRDILEEDVGVDGLPDDNHDIPVDELAAACTPEQASEALGELASFSICDPACGSGQFLVPAVERVAEIRQALADRTDADVHHAAHVWAATHTVYGVDLVPETVRMARLRVKLRVVDALPAGAPEEVLEEDLPRIREGRHLEHQIKHGNSLIGISDMSKLEDALSEDEPSGQTTLAGGDWA